MTKLSQKLANLSSQTKKVEDRIAQTQFEARQALEQQRVQVREQTEQVLGDLHQKFDQAKGETQTRVAALQGKVSADIEQMKRDAGEAKRGFESWQADNYASDKEADALAAIDYASAAVQIAELQALDAIAARAGAEVAEAASPPLATA